MATDLASQLEQYKKLKIVDVRKPGEYEAEHVETAQNTPLDYLNEHLAEIPKDEVVYLHGAGGYRSMIAASIIKSQGFQQSG